MKNSSRMYELNDSGILLNSLDNYPLGLVKLLLTLFNFLR
jgi:hypothetical protein